MPHLDEGTIHAWLDGALSPAEAEAAAAHAAGCAVCAAAVAQARGVIAGASRILLALDDVPGGVLPRAAAPPAVAASALPPPAVRRPRSWSSWPVRVAASVAFVAVGALVTRQALRRDAETGSPSAAMEMATDSAPISPAAPAQEPAAATKSSSTAPPPAAAPEAAAAPPGAGRGDGAGSARLGRPGSRTELRVPITKVAPPPAAAAPDERTLADAAPDTIARAAPMVAARERRPIAEQTVGQEAGARDAAAAVGAATGAPGDTGGAVASAVVRGRVVDAASGAPVAGASVTIPGTSVGTVTDADGRYAIVDPPAEARSVVVRRVGFEQAIVPIARPAAEAVVSLPQATLQLSEVVTTGAAAARRARTAGNAMATVRAEAAPAPSSQASVAATAEALARSAPRVIEGLPVLEHTLRREDSGRTRAGVDIVQRTQDVHILTYELRPGVPVRLLVRLPAAGTRRTPGARAPIDTTPERSMGEVNVIHWREGDGAELQLSGPVSLDELEALRARVIIPPPPR
jgi:hypothetical protein